MEKGYIHIYTGNGKGKTTAALGLALRAAGYGYKTFIGQFMKGSHYGELDSLKNIKEIDIEQFGGEKCITLDQVDEKNVGHADLGSAREQHDKNANDNRQGGKRGATGKGTKIRPRHPSLSPNCAL